MPAAVVTNGTASTTKSRGQLKRLKKKAKAANADSNASVSLLAITPPSASCNLLPLTECSQSSCRFDVPLVPQSTPSDRVDDRPAVVTATATDYVVEDLKAPEGFADVFAHFQPPAAEEEEVRNACEWSPPVSYWITKAIQMSILIFAYESTYTA